MKPCLARRKQAESSPMDISEKGFEAYIQEYLQEVHDYRVRVGIKQRHNPDYDLKYSYIFNSAVQHSFELVQH